MSSCSAPTCSRRFTTSHAPSRIAVRSVSGIGSTPQERLRAGLKRHLDAWETVRSPFDGDEVAQAVRRLAARRPVDALETVEERLIEPAAAARAALGLPGLSVESARLCRDKPAMKAALRAAGLPCAESAAAASLAELEAFAERVGFPADREAARRARLARRRFASTTAAGCARAAAQLGVDRGESVAVEEFIEGHEGFYDTVSIDGEPRLEFVSHYYPSVPRSALRPQDLAADRGHQPRRAGELRRAAGDRPQGHPRPRDRHLGDAHGVVLRPEGTEGLRDRRPPPGRAHLGPLLRRQRHRPLPRVGEAIVTGRIEAQPSRRYATGSVQVRPDRDGKIVAYERLDQVLNAAARRSSRTRFRRSGGKPFRSPRATSRTPGSACVTRTTTRCGK